MTVKILLLKSGEDVIADVQEMLSSDEQVMGYFLNKPCVIKLNRAASPHEQAPEGAIETSVSMIPWMPLAKEKAIPLSTDWAVTMVTPVDKIDQMYREDILKDGQENNQTDSDDEQHQVGLTD